MTPTAGSRISGSELNLVPRTRQGNTHGGFMPRTRCRVSCLCQLKSARRRIRLLVSEANLILAVQFLTQSSLRPTRTYLIFFFPPLINPRFLSYPLPAFFPTTTFLPSLSSVVLLIISPFPTMVDWNTPTEIATDYGACLAPLPSVPPHYIPT